MFFKKDVPLEASELAERAERAARSGGLSMLSSGCRFEGRVCLRGDARVGGEVQGTIVSSALLIVEQNAVIRGDIKGKNVLVNGRVEGNILATDALRLSPSSVVIGDLSAKRLIVEDGACIDGRISKLVDGENLGVALPEGARPNDAADSGPNIRNAARVQQAALEQAV